MEGDSNMALYAVIPVLIKIDTFSAAEIQRAHTLVNNVIDFWQETCVNAWNNDAAGDIQGAAKSPKDMADWIEHCDLDPDPYSVEIRIKD
jgi:hypothetical protein